MLAGTHIAAGALIYRASEDKPAWLRWPLVIGGGFLSHWMLDSLACYHNIRGGEWYDVAFIGVQAAAAFLVGLQTGPKGFAAGLWAWLSWDWERVAGVNWLHGAATTWAPRYFSECSSRPATGLWEVALVVGLVALMWRWRNEATDSRRAICDRDGDQPSAAAAPRDLRGSDTRGA